MSPGAINSLIWLLSEAIFAGLDIARLVQEIEQQGGEMTDEQRAEIAKRFGSGIDKWKGASG